MTSGQYRALMLVLVILGVEILTNPVVKTVVGGWLSFGQGLRRVSNTQSPLGGGG